MARPTRTSAQPEPVTATPPAATRTPTFAITSFREQSQAERMLRSSARRRHRSHRQAPFAIKAMTPTPPMISAAGTVPRAILDAASVMRPTANAAMMAPLSIAALACQAGPRATTYRLNP